MKTLRCPVCQKGKLYRGLLTLNDHCPACNVSFKESDTGDGPAFIVGFLLCTVIAPLAIAVEFIWSPPVWAHVVLWSLSTVLFSILFLRLTKAILVQLKFRHRRYA